MTDVYHKRNTTKEKNRVDGKKTPRQRWKRSKEVKDIVIRRREGRGERRKEKEAEINEGRR